MAGCGRLKAGKTRTCLYFIPVYTANLAPFPSDSFDDPDITLCTTCQRCQCRLIIRAIMHFAGSLDAVKFDDNNTFRLPLLISL